MATEAEKKQIRSEAAKKAAQTRRENREAEEAHEEARETETRNWSWLPWVLLGLALLIALLLWHPWTTIIAAAPTTVAAAPTLAPVVVQPTLAPATTLGPATQPPIVSDPALDHGNNPQPYIPHPNFYVETGVSDKEYTWTVNVSDGEVMVVGGTSVNGLSGGTYQGFGPGKYTVKVINGFVSVVKAEWGKNEWDFRIGQAVQYNWAHANENPGPIK